MRAHAAPLPDFGAGIEAVNVKLKRMMGLGRLRVRGLGQVRFAIMLNVLGWNILQAAQA